MTRSLKLPFILSLIILAGCMSSGPKFSNQNPNRTSANFTFFERLSLMKKVFFDQGDRFPKEKLPEVRPNLDKFLAQEDSLKFIWFGHSTILLNLDGKNILIDPIFSEAASPFSFVVKRFQPPVLSLEELPEIDFIVISHDHYDHLDKKTIKYFSSKKTQYLVPLKVSKHLKDWGVKPELITELNWHESTQKDGITFIATPAQHFSGRTLFDANSTLWASWVIQGSKEKIYFSGDTGYSEHFKEIGEKYGPFNYAFIENGQYNERWPYSHLHPEETIQAMKEINAQNLVPIHWGMFTLSLHPWNEPIERTYELAQNEKIKIITPRLGEMVHSSVDQQFFAWWELNKKDQVITEAEILQEE